MDKMRKYERLQLPSGVHLTAARHTIDGEHPQHWHGYSEIEIILSGSGKYIINDVEYDISENDVFFLTSTDFHYMKVSEQTELINISFDNFIFGDNEIPFLNSVENAYKLDKGEYERLVSAANILLHEYEISGDCQKQLLQYVIKSLLRKSKSSVSGEKSVTREQNNSIKRSIIYMEMHFSEKITLEAVAGAAGYSPTYFSDLFARLTGETYIDTLTKIRLGYARSMLANGSSVSNACFLSGFGSLSNFLETFKKHYGIPPSVYKRNAAEASK